MIILDKCVVKDVHGGWKVHTRAGKYLGTFLDKDKAMERFWSWDDQCKGIKNREREKQQRYF